MNQNTPVKIIVETKEQLSLFILCLGKWGSFITARMLEAEREHRHPKDEVR